MKEFFSSSSRQRSKPNTPEEDLFESLFGCFILSMVLCAGIYFGTSSLLKIPESSRTVQQEKTSKIIMWSGIITAIIFFSLCCWYLITDYFETKNKKQLPPTKST